MPTSPVAGDLPARCRTTKADGTPCRGAARPSGFCVFHDPGLAGQRAEGRRRGGRQRSRPAAVLAAAPDLPLQTICDVQALLGQTINETRQGKLDPNVANAIGYLCSVFLKAVEAGALPEEDAALQRQLEELRHVRCDHPARPEGDAGGAGSPDGSGAGPVDGTAAGPGPADDSSGPAAGPMAGAGPGLPLAAAVAPLFPPGG
jgi:hypothetical protein